MSDTTSPALSIDEVASVPPTKSEYHLTIDRDDCKAPELLQQASSLSITCIKQAMQKGAVWLTDQSGTRRLRRAAKVLKPGNELHFYYDARILATQIEPPLLLADENEYSVWIKPRGVLSQGSKWGDHSTIGRWIEANDSRQRPAFIIHRLDRAARGLMIIGHSKRTARLFSAMFEGRRVDKKYLAVVHGRFEFEQKPLRIDSALDGRSAVSHVMPKDYDAGQKLSLLEITIETGRKHQIRRHLQANSLPIVGDRLYGGGSEFDLQLSAISLAFRCPVSDDFKIYTLPGTFCPDFNLERTD